MESRDPRKGNDHPDEFVTNTYEDQLTERGWFFDTDATAGLVQECCDGLSGRSWTELFPSAHV